MQLLSQFAPALGIPDARANALAKSLEQAVLSLESAASDGTIAEQVQLVIQSVQARIEHKLSSTEQAFVMLMLGSTIGMYERLSDLADDEAEGLLS